MKKKLTKLLRARHADGAVLTEYGLLAGLLVTVSIAAVAATGGDVRSAYCKATNGMAQIAGGLEEGDCLVDTRRPVELGPSERYVDTPAIMTATFTDMAYGSAETGERLVMTSVEGEPAAAYWLDTTIASRDPYEPNRTIASCYQLGAETDAICSVAQGDATISVPPEATAIGYLVTLGEDTGMPWGNDVSVAVPGGDGVQAHNWSFEVVRDDPEPVFMVSYDFPDHTFEASDTDWQPPIWTPLLGEMNVPAGFMVEPDDDYRGLPLRACYRMPDGGAEECSIRNSIDSYPATIEVPAGAAEVGIQMSFGEPEIGPDFRTLLNTQLTGNETTIGDSLAVTRPNEPVVTDVSFAMPDHVFAQTDTGWATGPRVPLEGDYNVDLFLTAGPASGPGHKRKICYAMEIGGTLECSPANSPDSYGTGIDLPVGAREIAYQIDLPEEKIGNDWTIGIEITIKNDDVIVHRDPAQVTRPNEPIVTNVSFEMPDHVFAQTDTGWVTGPRVALEGDYNVDLWIAAGPSSGQAHKRKICYAMEVGGTLECSPANPVSSYGTGIDLPVGAKEIAYQINLPAEATGNDWVTEISISIRNDDATVHQDLAQVTRPNEPISTAFTFDIPDEEFAASDAGWTYGTFVPIVGDYNITMRVAASPNGGHNHYRKVCYKMDAASEPQCSPANSTPSYGVGWDVPAGAQEIGYQVRLPAEGVNFSAGIEMLVKRPDTNSWLFSDTFTVTRGDGS